MAESEVRKPRTAGVAPFDAAGGENSENVMVAVTGAVYVDSTGTSAAPTDATTPLAETWHNVGYISEDAVTESIETDTNEIIAWQNSDVVRTLVTKFGVNYSFTMIETNSVSVGLYYGKAVAAAATNHQIGGERVGRQAFVIDAIDSAGQVVRRYMPAAEVTERGEVAISGTDAVGYEVTLATYPTDTLQGASVDVHYGTALT